MRGLKPKHGLVLRTWIVSHLLQMRGLKLLNREGYRTGRQVASFTDAWIETKRGTTTREIGKSHLLQMRGLKPDK